MPHALLDQPSRHQTAERRAAGPIHVERRLAFLADVEHGPAPRSASGTRFPSLDRRVELRSPCACMRLMCIWLRLTQELDVANLRIVGRCMLMTFGIDLLGLELLVVHVLVVDERHPGAPPAGTTTSTAGCR